MTLKILQILILALQIDMSILSASQKSNKKFICYIVDVIRIILIDYQLICKIFIYNKIDSRFLAFFK